MKTPFQSGWRNGCEHTAKHSEGRVRSAIRFMILIGMGEEPSDKAVEYFFNLFQKTEKMGLDLTPPDLSFRE